MSIKCDKDMLMLYSSKELEKPKEELVVAHLNECKECRDFLAEITSVESEIRELPETKPSYDIANTALKIHKIRHNNTLLWLKPLIAVAATIVISLSILYFIPEKQEEPVHMTSDKEIKSRILKARNRLKTARTRLSRNSKKKTKQVKGTTSCEQNYSLYSHLG